jgi:hypothetical protein
MISSIALIICTTLIFVDCIRLRRRLASAREEWDVAMNVALYYQKKYHDLLGCNCGSQENKNGIPSKN